MKPVSKVHKGKRFEDFFSAWLRNTGLDPTAHREIGSGSGKRKSDIRTQLPLSFELKDQARPSLLEWVKQADKQTFGYNPFCLIWHPPRGSYENSVAIINLDLLEKLLKAFFK